MTCEVVSRRSKSRLSSTHVLEQIIFLLSPISHALVQHSTSTSTLTSDSHLVWVATELACVLLDPLQGKIHVKQASIEHSPLLYVLRRKEAESTETVLDDNANEAIVVLLHELSRIESCCAKQAITTSI